MAELPPDKPNLRFALETIPQGELTSLMQPQPLAKVHPFAPTLRKWQQGIPVDCSPNWAWSVIEAAVERRPHPTARTPDLIALFAKDIEYQNKAGFFRVFLWEDLKQHLPANFKISPVAVVPQVGRRGQIILDLLFPVYQDINGVIMIMQESMNNSTVLAALPEVVKEIGKVFPWLLQYMQDTPEGLHILFSKLDISNGFWHLVVWEADNFNFAYVLPQQAGKPVRIVVPSAVQMGWVESPPLFCAVTKSAWDLTQHLVENKVDLPPHPLKDKISIKDMPMRAWTATPTKLLQVYMDDFCNTATQSVDRHHILLIRQASIHGVHAVFPELAVTGHKNGKNPLSEKKLDQGDGNFVSKKDMIGFSFDGIKRTIHLPPNKAVAYIRETQWILRWKSVLAKDLQILVGKLRHASIILPAARGHFTPINVAMQGEIIVVGLGAASEIHAALEDLIFLIHLLGSRPTHFQELVVDMPQYVGYHDATAEGAGGVWFSLSYVMPPVVWRVAFPPDIAQDVISIDNPSGSITNLDLELAAEVFAIGVILGKAPVIRHQPIGMLCNNTPTVSWIKKMASKSQSPAAGVGFGVIK